MDKRSILAYVLIGLVIMGYFAFNQPSPEDIQKQKAQQEQREQEQIKEQLIAAELQRAAEKEFIELKSDTAGVHYNVLNGSEEIVTLSNDKISIDLSTYGGRISRAVLKEYKDQSQQDLVLFDSKDKGNLNDENRLKNGPNKLDYLFEFKQGLDNINTDKCYFTVQEKSDSSAVLRLDFKEGRYIDFTYSLNGNSYMVNLSIKAHNMASLLSTKDNITIDWKQLLRQ